MTRPVLSISVGIDGLLERRERSEDFGYLFKLDPVELDVLPGAEVAIAAILGVWPL